MFTPFSTDYAQNRCNGFHSAYCFSSDLRIMIFYILRNKPAQHQANQYCTYFLRGEVCLICYALKIFRLNFQNTIHQIFFAFKCNVCFFCVCMIFFLFLIVTIYLLKQKSPYEYLKEQKGMTAQTTANECLEEIRFDNKYIVFFINENGNLSCAVMKKKIFSYEILRISGELSQSKNSKNYLFSSYEDN